MGTNSLQKQNLLHFSVYKHNIMLNDGTLVSKMFIVLKNEYGVIVKFTKLHEYIHSKYSNTAKSIHSNGRNKFIFVCQFLNYIFFENNLNYGISHIYEIDKYMVQDFFYYYGLADENGKGRTKATVEQCGDAILNFLLNYIKKNKKHCVLAESDISVEKVYYTQRGMKKVINVPAFDLLYSKHSNEILRDITDSVFFMILEYAIEYYPELIMLIALGAFAGLRPSEACNVRQEISPLGPGIMFTYQNNRINKIEIDLRHKYRLRSDMVDVGGIKKKRIQKVYPAFFDIFMHCYKTYKDYLATQTFEKEYCPLNLQRDGLAMTYPAYATKFNKMIQELRPQMLLSDDLEIQEFGHLLLSHTISPHIFRHWFSVRLTLAGETEVNLMHWRGDKSIESATTYLLNKSALNQQFNDINNELFNSMMEFNALKELSNE